jgi:hypothetical protein
MNTRTSIWIRNPTFDLSLVMGGALLTLLLPLVVRAVPAWLPLIFWTWVVVFEGSHFWATYSRTYLDSAFRSENGALLRWSGVFFLLPASMVALRAVTDSSWPTDLYGYLIFWWSLYHNVRQHYGFVSIYSKKSGNPPALVKQYRRLIYWAIAGAQIYFALVIKTELALSVAPFRAWPELVQGMLTWGPPTVSGLAALGLGLLAARSFRAGGKGALLPALYTATCLVFYAVMFFVVAPREPFFSGATNGAQRLMLIAVMNSLFHNIQYHAIVWHYSARRYREGSFGFAQRINGTTPGYLAAAVVMGLGFAGIVVGLNDWPTPFGHQAAAGEFPAVAYVLFFGIIGHHFYLDQKIWRPSRQVDLAGYLGVSAAREPNPGGI